MINSSAVLLVFYDHKFVRLSNGLISILKFLVIAFVFPYYNNLEVALLISSIPAFILCIIFYFRINNFISKEYIPLTNDIKSRISKMSSRSILGRYMTYLIWTKSEVLYIGYYYDTVLVAIYSIGYDLAQRFVQTIKSPISDLDLIYGMEYSNKNSEKYIKILKFTNTFICYFFIPISLTAFFTSQIIIPVIFGTSYYDSVFVFRMILVAYSITFFAFHINSAIASLELWNLMLIIQLIGGGINVFLNILLIPIYGIEGAVVSVIASIFFVTIFWNFYLLKFYPNLVPYYKILKMLISSLPLICILIYANKIFDAESIQNYDLVEIIIFFSFSFVFLLSGFLLYILISILLQVINQEELDLIKKFNNRFAKKYIIVHYSLQKILSKYGYQKNYI